MSIFGDNFWWNVGNKIEDVKFNITTSSPWTDVEETKWGIKQFLHKKLSDDKGAWVWNEKERHYDYVE